MSVSDSRSTVVTPEMKTDPKLAHKKKKSGAKAEAQLRTQDSQNSLASILDSTAVMPDMKTGAKTVRKKKKPGANADVLLAASDILNTQAIVSNITVRMQKVNTGTRSVCRRKKSNANAKAQVKTSDSQSSQVSSSDSTKSVSKKQKPCANTKAQPQTLSCQNSKASLTDSTTVTQEMKAGAKSVSKKQKPSADAGSQLQTPGSQNSLASSSDSTAVTPGMKTAAKSVSKKKKSGAKADVQLRTQDCQNSHDMKTDAKSVCKKKKPGANAKAQFKALGCQNSKASSLESATVTQDMKNGAKSVRKRKRKKLSADAGSQLQTPGSQNSLASSSDRTAMTSDMKTGTKSVCKKKKPCVKAEAKLQTSESLNSQASTSESTAVTPDMKTAAKSVSKKKKSGAKADVQLRTQDCQNSLASSSDSTVVTPDMKTGAKSVCKKKKPGANAKAQFKALGCQNSKASSLESATVTQDMKTGAKSVRKRKRKKRSADAGSQLPTGRQTSQTSTFDSTAVTPEIKTSAKSMRKKKKPDENAETQPKTSDSQYSNASISNAAVTMEMKDKTDSAFKKQNGEASVVRTEVQLRPSDIRYSQSSISNKFQDGTKIGELLDDIYFGRCFASALKQIEVALVMNVWVSADNRRLWVMKQLESLGRVDFITVKVLKKVFSGKCTSDNGGLSVEIRNGPPGGILYPLMYPESTTVSGKKKRRRRKRKNKQVGNDEEGKQNTQDSACETVTDKCHLDSAEESSDGFDDCFNDMINKQPLYGEVYDCHLENYILEYNEDLQDDETFWNIYSYSDDNSQLDEENETTDTEPGSSDDKDAYIETFPVNEYETSMKGQPAYDWFDFVGNIDCYENGMSEKRNIPMQQNQDDLPAITAKHSSSVMIDSKVPPSEKFTGINPASPGDGSLGFDRRSIQERRVNLHHKKHYENTSFSRIGNGVHSYGGLHDLAAPYESDYEQDALEIAYGGIDSSDLCNNLYCDRCARLRCYRAMDIGPYYEPPCGFLLSGDRTSSIYHDSGIVIKTCSKTTSGLHSSGKLNSQTTTESSQPSLVDRAKSGITAVLNFFDRIFS